MTSAEWASTVAPALAAVQHTTAPAPARNAATDARTAAPVNARLPTTAATRPALYLWASAARRGSARRT